MTRTEVITILAILLAPVLAFSAQWVRDHFREKRERKIWIFRTLMSTRASILSPEHVNALNLIDLEFNGAWKKDKDVRDAWHTYHDQLYTQRPPDDPATQAVWDNRSADLRNSLLYKMSLRLGFGFELSTIQRGAYAPDYYKFTEIDFLAIRMGLRELLKGRRSVKMDVQSFPVDEKVLEAQKRQLMLSIEYLEGRRPLPVTVVEAEKDEGKAIGPGPIGISTLLPPPSVSRKGE